MLYKKDWDFKKKNSIAHEIISLIENIETEIDNSFVCGIFIDLQINKLLTKDLEELSFW